ncbi:hypothetical protein GCM10023196_055710 [Actinoallomurus vinaceus]|uniref:Uncharacterized protein n=1 Tax=Actinoallomurus vinaceus TaxID=1080074 RepID=A0ABP8UEX8_9ACTN
MALPGFTADISVYRSRRQYRTVGGTSASTRHGSVMPQQDNIEAPGTCCGKHCPGLCICQHGVPACTGVIEPENPLPTLLRATDSVATALDSCHADQPVDGGYAFVVCPCGCWATTHDAGCFHCKAAVEEPATVLKG